MLTRAQAFFSVALLAAGTAGAFAQPPATPADPNAPILTENYEDWTLRCFNVRGPAPCDMLQVAVNKQNQQRVLSVSIAYVPERNAYAMQMVVPLGVSLGKGMTLNAGTHSLKNVHFNRCSREGCYVEVIVDADSINALAASGNTTNIVVYPYGRTTDAKLPLSLKGFTASVARLKVLATQRAVHSAGGGGGGGQAPAPAPAQETPAPAPTPAPHAPPHPAPHPAPGH